MRYLADASGGGYTGRALSALLATRRIEIKERNRNMWCGTSGHVGVHPDACICAHLPRDDWSQTRRRPEDGPCFS